MAVPIPSRHAVPAPFPPKEVSLLRSTLPIALATCLAGAGTASAGTIEVTTLQINAPPSECELDEAIEMVNDFPNDDRFGCERQGGGDDRIVFDGGLDGTVTLDDPLPAIERTLTIDGGGADRITIDGAGLYRPLTVNAGVAFTLASITVANGSAAGGNGGALQIQTGADVVLRDCRIRDSAAQNGGGIEVEAATLRVERCLLDDNQATAAGGALRNAGGTVELVNTTLSGNGAADGGGIAAVEGASPGTTSLYSVTLADNGGESVFVGGAAVLEARHTIFAEPCSGALTSLDFNLASDLTCGLSGPNDLEGAPAGLAALAANGGPTATHALQPGSAAIDAGDTDCRDASGTVLATDQRGPGFPRVTNGDGLPGFSCDLGAYEAAPEPAGAAAAAAAAAALAALARRRRRRLP